ncbi:MAG: iron-containing alcohol dehydrogenase [Dysgonamonadaceae bacterium]|jgi:alcohol dehydrogenase YqhD (iron-dependent ADH family)|nr:iron-containing alcohol dehydrogenase [Dysgonamonadaceae bacterium]
MNNFSFCSPTEFVFGRNTESEVGKLLKKRGASRVMIHYGSGSAVRSGLLKRIESCLQNEFIDYVLLGGVQPNPVDDMVYRGIDFCRSERVDFILAIGGGSVIDSAKAIAAGVPYGGDFWNFFDGKVIINKTLPVGVVLTIPAAGSEGSVSSVITQKASGLKRSLWSQHFRPAFAVMNPELTCTLPPFQTACGIADMMAHVMERYFSGTPGVELTDRLCEALLLTIIKEAKVVMADPENYTARANLMWAGTLAHNGICGAGREEDWASHKLEHELSARYGVAHGAGLAVTFPAWANYVAGANLDLFVQFATRIWNIQPLENKRETARQGIRAMRDFFSSIGLPVNFQQLGARKEDIDDLVAHLKINTGGTFGALVKLDMNDARQIYEAMSEGISTLP